LCSSSRWWGKELQTFLEYPPMQRGASFNLDAVESGDGEKDGTSRGGKQRTQPVIEIRLVAGERLKSALARKTRPAMNMYSNIKFNIFSALSCF